jgi:carnitine O-acetyltransferase
VSGSEEAFTCFGPLVTDGYGCCYNIRDHDILFGLSAFKSCMDTNVHDFHDALHESLQDIQDVLLSNSAHPKL